MNNTYTSLNNLATWLRDNGYSSKFIEEKIRDSLQEFIGLTVTEEIQIKINNKISETINKLMQTSGNINKDHNSERL